MPITHDLQEPLRMVVNFTELLGREYAGKLARKPTNSSPIVEGALRIEALLKALLSYWRLPSASRTASPPVDSAPFSPRRC